MSITVRAYEEVIDFIAAGPSPKKVASFHPSEAAKTRVAELMRREEETGLMEEEMQELENYVRLEHIMRLAKARAQQYLSRK